LRPNEERKQQDAPNNQQRSPFPGQYSQGHTEHNG
jgi:hypothetical protein